MDIETLKKAIETIKFGRDKMADKNGYRLGIGYSIEVINIMIQKGAVTNWEERMKRKIK